MDNKKNIGTVGFNEITVDEETPAEIKKRKKEEKEAALQDELEMKAMIHHKSWERKNAKRARFRPLKNFGWWLLGFFSFIIITAGALFGVAYFVKIKDVAGKDADKYVSNDVANMSFFEAAMNLPNYKVSDLPIVKELLSSLIESTGANKLIEVDLDKLDSAKLLDGEILTVLKDSIKVVATLDSLGATEFLGGLGGASLMTDFELVPTEELPNEAGTDFNAKLYYYLDNEGKYQVAFSENHQRVSGAIGKDLYFPALKDVVLLDLPSVLTDRINREKVSNLLTSFGFGSDNSFVKILGDTTVEGMPSFDINNVQVDMIIAIPEENAENYESVKELYSVLLDATDNEYDDTDYETFKASCDAIKVGDLSNIDIEKVKLSSIIKIPESTAGNYDQVCRIYQIILDATGIEYDDSNFTEKCNTVTLKSIGDMDTDKIRICTVLPITHNEQLYDILRDITGTEGGAENNSKMTVGDLSGSDITHIKLVNVLPLENNDRLYDVLRDLSKENVIEQLIIDKMIQDKIDNHDPAFEGYADWNYTAKAQAVQNMRATYLKETSLIESRRAAATEAYESTLDKNSLITVASLDKASIEDIKLRTVMGTTSSNKIINKLLQDDNATVSNIGDELNNLTLAEIYEVEVFSTTGTPCTYGDGATAAYEKSEVDGKEVYTLSASGTYYITEDASIWLFLLYDCDGVDVNGFGTKYTSNNKTLSGIDDSITEMSGKISSATIRQLVSAGVISNDTDYGATFALSLGTALSMLSH